MLLFFSVFIFYHQCLSHTRNKAMLCNDYFYYANFLVFKFCFFYEKFFAECKFFGGINFVEKFEKLLYILFVYLQLKVFKQVNVKVVFDYILFIF